MIHCSGPRESLFVNSCVGFTFPINQRVYKRSMTEMDFWNQFLDFCWGSSEKLAYVKEDPQKSTWRYQKSDFSDIRVTLRGLLLGPWTQHPNNYEGIS